MIKQFLIYAFVPLIAMVLLCANSEAREDLSELEDDEAVYHCFTQITCNKEGGGWLDKCLEPLTPEEYRKLMEITNMTVPIEYRSAEGQTPEKYCATPDEMKREAFEMLIVLVIQRFSEVCKDDEEDPVCVQYRVLFECALGKMDEYSEKGLCNL